MKIYKMKRKEHLYPKTEGWTKGDGYFNMSAGDLLILLEKDIDKNHPFKFYIPKYKSVGYFFHNECDYPIEERKKFYLEEL